MSRQKMNQILQHPMLTIRTCVILVCVTTLWHGVATERVSAQDDGTPQWFNSQTRRSLSMGRDSTQMMRLVQPFSQAVSQSVVQVFSGRRAVALGIVVSEDGYVITKRSELDGDVISVRFSSARKYPARVAAVRRSSDLAMLKVETDESLTPATFSPEVPEIGSFLISPDRSSRMIGVGVVGVLPREIQHQGRLGVRLDENAAGHALVRFVWPESGAFQAGIKESDRILAVNGQDAPGRASVIAKLRQIYPGEVVRLTIMRGEEAMELDAVISDLGVLRESENDTKVNGPRSTRLSGFKSVIQHDTVLRPHECGGPVLDSSGRVIGMNIARAGRVVSYALPSSLIIPEVLSMLTESRAVVSATGQE